MSNVLKIESINQLVKDGQTEGWTDTQRKLLNGGYNMIPRTFESGRGIKS